MLNGWKGSLAVAGMAVAFGLPVGTAMAASHEPIKLRDNDDNDVPPIVDEAKIVKEAKREAKFELPARGQVWLFDADTKKVIHSIALSKGDTYAFDSKEDRIYVNGKPADKPALNADHTFRIYFVTKEDRDAKNDDRKDRDEKRVVPDTAKKVADGKDEEFSYKADEEGMAYLWDNTNNKLIESFHLQSGDRVTISPKSNAMSVNGKTVSRDVELSRHVEYRLLWDTKKK